jgi:hypothetical protein
VAVQVWVGEIPEHAQEREAIVALARGLSRLEELYLLLANFTVGGQEVDLLVLKQNGGFVIELKHCDGRVIGGVNGRWQVVDGNEEVHWVNPGRRNPYNQVISSFYRLSNHLNQHRRDFLSEHRAAGVDFRSCKRLVVISPSLHPESEIKLDWKVDLKGLDELPTYLVAATSTEIQLTEEELVSIPRLLRCELWNDVNLLIGEEVSVAETHMGVVETTPAEAIDEAVPDEGAIFSRVRRWPRWLAGILAGLALIVVAGLWLGVLPAIRGGVEPTVTPTATVATPVPTATQPPLPVPTQVTLIEHVEQAVVRESESAGGEVEVVLRTVEYQSEQIVLHWAMVNYGINPVFLPLAGGTVLIRDNIGNEYLVDVDFSEPPVLVAWPEQRVEGSCAVPRPVSPDAITLRIYVDGGPFEGRPPVWLVNIPGRE